MSLGTGINTHFINFYFKFNILFGNCPANTCFCIRQKVCITIFLRFFKKIHTAHKSKKQPKTAIHLDNTDFSMNPFCDVPTPLPKKSRNTKSEYT